MQDTFDQLCALMRASAPGTVVGKDGPRGLLLNAPWANPMHPKQPMYFGEVRLGKSYVSYMLIAV